MKFRLPKGLYRTKNWAIPKTAIIQKADDLCWHTMKCFDLDSITKAHAEKFYALKLTTKYS